MENSKNMDETLDVLAAILGRCLVMCVAILLFWFAVIMLAGDLAYKFHSSMLQLSRESFYTIHYAGAMTFKALAGMFFAFPYFAIKMVQKKRRNQA